MAGNVEDIKLQSKGLRGSLLASLQDSVTGALADSDQVLIKYHGSYQQDDRDLRDERRRAKLEPAHSFMIRTRTPGGALTPWQWLRLDRLAQDYAERGLRITSRQALQFHGVIKRELKATMQGINQALIDTLAACGDVNRNIAVSQIPDRPELQAALLHDARALSDRLLPATRAYYEIWLDEQQIAGVVQDDAIYGASYLPRKFKIGFALPPVNDVDVLTQDLGFTAIVEDGQFIGYNVSVGGGMGASHNDAQTYPRLANTIGFIARADLQAVAIAVLTTQRDFGNREVRKRARLKYTIDDRGIDWFTKEVSSRSGVAFAPAKTVVFEHGQDRLGWYANHANQNLWQLGLRVPAGRLQDAADQRWQSAIREIAKALLARAPTQKWSIDSLAAQHEPYLSLSANQNLTLANIPQDLRAQVDQLLLEHGIDETAMGTHNPVFRDAIACVALPTCGLAMAEAERALADVSTQIYARWHSVGLNDAPLQLRISGCPNGCSRPYTAEIALVGKAPGRYNLFLGGDFCGAVLNQLHRENLDLPTIFDTLGTWFARYAKDKEPNERFGAFFRRTQARAPAQQIAAVLL
jgi:sulfite reductase (NADPH) hemoprotein beta-component